MPKYLFPTLFFLLACLSAPAQRYLGACSGSKAQENCLYLNPASIGGCDKRFIITLASVNLVLDNNLGKISSFGKVASTLKKNSNGVKDVFNYSGNTKFSMLAPMAEVRGPGIIYAINNQHSLAFTTRLRFFNQFYNFNKLLFNIAIKSPTQASLTANMKNFKWVANSWSEAGLAYGGILSNSPRYQVKVGVALRFLGGIGYLGLSGKNLDIKLTPGIDSIPANNANLEFSSSLTGADNSFSASSIATNIFGGAGRGFGGDAGIMYISLLPGESGSSGAGQAPNYKYAISVSVTDIGAITYSEIINTHITGSGVITTNGLSNSIKSYSGLKDYVTERGFATTTSKKADIVYLPTALVAGIDSRVYRQLYTNIIFIGNMANDAHFGSRFYNQVTLLPHYDSKIFSVGLPVTYNTLTRNIRLGLGLRAGGFFLGSDDVLMFFKGGQYGLNFYLGGAIAIPPKSK